MPDPMCARCGHNLWLHAEMDFNGNRCCDCERFMKDAPVTFCDKCGHAAVNHDDNGCKGKCLCLGEKL